MIENSKVEEEIGGGADPGSHARRAFECSQEAIDLAKHTQHHLLLANAHLWQGLTQCNSFFDNPEAAREAYDLARASCAANQPDNNMWQDLQRLGAKILRKGSVHPALKAWSQGAVGEKTFRQISEEFAEVSRGSGSAKAAKYLEWRLGSRLPQKGAAHPGAGETAKATVRASRRCPVTSFAGAAVVAASHPVILTRERK